MRQLAGKAGRPRHGPVSATRGSRVPTSAPVRTRWHPCGPSGARGLGILVASAVICHAGSFLPTDASLGVYQVAIVFAAVLGLAIALVGILTPRRFNLQFLYRWMCPFVMACLACLVWFPVPLGGEVAFVGSIGARLAFCLLTQVYFARIAGEGRFTPLQAFGLGWISLHLGDLAGVTFNVRTLHLAPSFAGSASCALLLSLVLVVVVKFALNGERTFAGQALPPPRCEHVGSGGGCERPRGFAGSEDAPCLCNRSGAPLTRISP